MKQEELMAKLSFGAGERVCFFGRSSRLDEFVESVMMEQSHGITGELLCDVEEPCAHTGKHDPTECRENIPGKVCVTCISSFQLHNRCVHTCGGVGPMCPMKKGPPELKSVLCVL